MGRSRLPLELIPKEKSRKITFQKRAMGLKKKTMEISTMCGVDACMIVYGNKEMGLEPVLYPTDPQSVQDIIQRYKDHTREERGMKIVDLSGFFEEVTKKIHKEINKRSGNEQAKYPTWDDHLNNLPMDELREHINTWDAKIEAVSSRIELLKMNQAQLELPPPLMNFPSYGSSGEGAAVGPSTQSVYRPQYLSSIDPMQLMANPMANPLMSKAMMSHFNTGRPSFNAQYSVLQPHAYFYDQTVMMENNINTFMSSSSHFYQQPVMPSPVTSYIPPNQMVPIGPQPNRAYDHYDVNDTKQGRQAGVEHMGRSRLPLELIPKEKSRKITFQKRAMGLKKKTMEISTLCGVDACMIVYGNKEMGLEPVLYPTDPQSVQDIIQRYKDHTQEERDMKTVDLSGFFEEVTKKIHKEINKRSGNEQAKYPTWDDHLNNIPMDELREHINTWDAKIEAVSSRIELLKMNQAQLELPPLMNFPSCGSSGEGAATRSSTQSVYRPQYLSSIDPMQLMANPMANPLRSKTMMSHFNTGRPSFNAQYFVPQPHVYFFDQTVMMENNINTFMPSSSRFYEQPIMPSPVTSYIPPNQMMPIGPQTNRAYDHYDVNDTKQGI